MRIAFKEWAAVCQALGAGQQIVILRKGGIAEPGGRFTVDHREFLLLPTYLHQSREDIRAEYVPLLDNSLARRPAEGTAEIQFHAQVVDARQIHDEGALASVAHEHIWSERIARERFHRWQGDLVHALIVRVFELPRAVTIELLPQYEGCKSWVELATEIPTAGARPVVGDVEFARRWDALRTALAGDG